MKVKFMKYAINYDDVVNFVYDSDDFITKKIIDYYKNYIFGLIPKLRYKIRVFDKVVNKYLNDIYFCSFVKTNLDYEDVDFYYDLDNIMIDLYKKYLYNENRKISSNRWL